MTCKCELKIIKYLKELASITFISCKSEELEGPYIQFFHFSTTLHSHCSTIAILNIDWCTANQKRQMGGQFRL